jgi:hypothetical protein
MVKAILPEPQFPVDVKPSSQGKGLKPWLPDMEVRSDSMPLIMEGRLAESKGKETNKEPKGFYDELYNWNCGMV